MYYRMHPAAALRGWKNAACMLVKRPENQVRPLTGTQFSVLMLCDGATPLKRELLNAEENSALQQFVDCGLVSVSAEPLPLEEDQRFCFYENRFIQQIMWSVTGACNYRCRHCFVDGPGYRDHGLAAQEALAVIDQMAACGVMQVELTGGEPLVRPDWWQLVDRLCEHHIYISQIYTNGALVNDAFFAEMEKRHLSPVLTFSFDGVNGWHDWMRGLQGAEETTLRAMEAAVKHGFTVYAGMCLHRGNEKELPETVKKLAAMGVAGLNVSGVTMSPLWQQHQEGCAMSEKEYLQACMDYFPRYFEDGAPMTVILNGAAILQKENARAMFDHCAGSGKRYYLCGEARFAPYLSAEGVLLPCMPMGMCREKDVFPSVREKGLAACLNDSFFLDYTSRCTEDLFAANAVCGSCPSRGNCGGGCRANALQESHDLMGCDPYQCLIWKEGYGERLKEAMEQAIQSSR